MKVVQSQPKQLDTRELVDQLTLRHARDIARLGREEGVVPHLAVILGQDDGGAVHGASASYVTRKEKHGLDIGARATTVQVGRAAVARAIERCNSDPLIHGQIVQLPLPKHPGETEQALRAETDQLLAGIEQRKDVDGLRPRDRSLPFDAAHEFAAATPAAVMRILDWQDRIPLTPEARVAVIGSEGFLVGRHMGPLLRARGINPLEHDKSLLPPDMPADGLEERLRSVVQQADIVISCVGRAGLLRPDMLHDGMVIVDAGVSPVPTAAGKVRILGDLSPSVADSGLEVLYTPPVGGVGPVTVCELWENTITAATQQAHY